MKARLIALTVVVALLMSLTAAAMASAAPPSLPHYFYGMVKVNEADAPAGTTVEARVAGVLIGSFNPIVTTQAGFYGSADPLAGVPRLLVQGNIAEGAIVSFYVNGTRSNETSTWRSGQNTVLNLTVGIAPAPIPTPIPPMITTSSAAAVSLGSATLSGTLTGLGTATAVNVFFEYGTTSYSFSTAPQIMNAAGAFSATITGLQPGMLYHFRARADGGANGMTTGSDVTFTASGTSPAVVTDEATSVTTDSAILNGTLTNMGTAASVDLSIEWGTTAGGPYPGLTVISAKTLPAAFTTSVAGLSPSTTYFFRARASGGTHGTSLGAEKSFTTQAASSGGGGGAGGGGGGGGAGAAPAVTSAPALPLEISISGGTGKVSIDDRGNIREEARIESKDGKVKLGISKDTKALNRDGKPVNGITGQAVPKDQAPKSAGGKTVVGQVMSFGPDGAVFAPPLEMVMSYAGEQLPPGVSEDRMVIAYWSGMEWVSVGGRVDPAARTVTATVSHFTMFAVTVLPAPPAPATVPTTFPAPKPGPTRAPAPPSSTATTPPLPATPPSVTQASPPAPAPAPVPRPTPAPEPVRGRDVTGWMIGALVAAAVVTTGALVYAARKNAVR